MFINVDFPSPLAPTNPICSPASRRNETSSKLHGRQSHGSDVQHLIYSYFSSLLSVIIYMVLTFCSGKTTIVCSRSASFRLPVHMPVRREQNASAKTHATGLAKHAAGKPNSGTNANPTSVLAAISQTPAKIANLLYPIPWIRKRTILTNASGM